jgi:hypothetical protein
VPPLSNRHLKYEQKQIAVHELKIKIFRMDSRLRGNDKSKGSNDS